MANLLTAVNGITAEAGTELVAAELVAKHAALAEVRRLSATLAADDMHMNCRELRRRYPMGSIAHELACSSADQLGLVSVDTLSPVIEAFAVSLDPLPANHEPPVPPLTEAADAVAQIRAQLAAIPVRNPAVMTVRRPMSQNSVQLELATGLHEVLTSESYIAESHALLTADLNSVVDNQVVVVPASTIVEITSDIKMQICTAVQKGRAQFSDSPERIGAQRAARERLDSDLREAEAALAAAEAAAEAKGQEAERVRLATPIAARFRKGGIVAINDATRELLHVLAAEGLAELVLPDA